MVGLARIAVAKVPHHVAQHGGSVALEPRRHQIEFLGIGAAGLGLDAAHMGEGPAQAFEELGSPARHAKILVEPWR